MNACVCQKYPESFAFNLFIILQYFTREICYFLKNWLTFWQFLLSFLFINKTLRLKNFKTRTPTNIYLLKLVIETLEKGVKYFQS